MISSYPTDSPRPVAQAAAVKRASWGAILAGAVVASALMILFTTFGIGIGAAALDPQYDRNPASEMGTGSAVYLVVTQLIAFGAGGYIAARLAGIPRPITSVLHGAAVWAVGTIFLAWATFMGAGAMFGAVSTVVSSSASAVGSTADAMVPDELSWPDLSKIAGSVSFDALPPEVQETLRQKGITEANIRQEAIEAFRNVFSRQEQEAVRRAARGTLADILRSPGNIEAELNAFFDRLAGGENAIISEEDRREAMAVLERRLNITPQEAQSIVRSVEDGLHEALDQAKAAIQEVRARALEAAQATSEAVATMALLVSLASVLALAAACGGAFGGKPESMIGERADDY